MKSLLRVLGLVLALAAVQAMVSASVPALASLGAVAASDEPATSAHRPVDGKPAGARSSADALAHAATAKEAPGPAETVRGPSVNKGDSAFMYVATIMVIMMSIPGLALFYGGLVRAKNMLSVLMQVMVVFALISVLWVVYGYTLAFGGPGAFYGSFDKLFLLGVTGDSLAATFTRGVYIPELAFVAFQCSFATIGCALIVGSFVERARFAAVLLFCVIWFTFAYLPVAHMVWYWDGPDAITDAKALEAVASSAGWLWSRGALDFAGGTVVHINAGIAGLVGSYMVGRRIGYGREPMPPHSLTLTMVGAALLWVGWFGFNAGSNLEATGTAAMAFVNTLVAAASAVLAWSFAEWIHKGTPSMLGAASGAVAGLVAITPACGFVGPIGAIVIGLVAGIVCLWGVGGLKRLLGADDSLDVFGIHGVGGIVGALLTAVFAAPTLGGTGVFDYVADAPAAGYSILGQLVVQAEAVLVTVVWSGLVSLLAYRLVDKLVGLRVPEEEERQGLDITSHGGAAYRY